MHPDAREHAARTCVCVCIYMYFTYLATHAKPGITGCLRGEGGRIEEGRKAQRGEGCKGVQSTGE